MGKLILRKDPSFIVADEEHAEQQEWAGPFVFVQAADCQLGMIDRYIKNRSGRDWSEELTLTEQVVEACNKMEPKPRFLVICGDLVDAYPGMPIRKDQVRDLKAALAKLSLDIPLVCVCGNHDIGDEPTFNSLKEYKQDFGNDYFYFSVEGVLFIVINTQFYKHRDFLKSYADEHDRWLDAILKKCKLFRYSIVFEHIPWFLNDPNEDDDYFNVTKNVRLNWLQKFKEAGVNKIMCGHYHRNAGGWFGDMELIVTSAIGAQLGDDKSGIRIVKVLEDRIDHQYYNIADIPSSIDL